MKKVIIIGSGFSGISAAAFMAKSGWDVTVLEKHSMPGGRARQFKEAGFTFDMGPSWYWMPGVFEQFFGSFGKKVSDYYNLKRLDPSYTVYWEKEVLPLPASFEKLSDVFERKETGSKNKLIAFLKEAQYKYEIGINKLVRKPGLSIKEFIDSSVIMGVFKLDVFNSIKKHVGKFFKNKQLRQLLEFPVLFLGALPADTPALYSLMNYADIKLGTWYPEGGMYEIVKGMYEVATEQGAEFKFNQNVTGFKFINNRISSVIVKNEAEELHFDADIIIGAADYQFIETKLLPKVFRSYSDKYWNSRKLAPSCLLYFIGVGKKLKTVYHHSLFFDVDFEKHADEIYKKPQWPSNPLFYVSATSVSDESVAPEGCENLFFLIPVAAGLDGDNKELRLKYFDIIVDRFEKRIGETIRESIIYHKNFGPSDFVNDYNAFKGNAYGLANTLMQTAILKPRCKSKKVDNLYFTGQLTVPGPGVPPCIISGEVVSNEVIRDH